MCILNAKYMPWYSYQPSFFSLLPLKWHIDTKNRYWTSRNFGLYYPAPLVNAITFIRLYLLFVRAINVFEIIQLYLCLCVRLMWDIYPTLLLTWLYGCCKHIYPAVLVISACGQCTYIHPDLLVSSAVIRILGCTSLQETGSFPVQSKMNDRTITRTTSGWLLA